MVWKFTVSEMVADRGNSYKQKKEALRSVIEDAEDEIEVLEERLDDLRVNSFS